MNKRYLTKIISVGTIQSFNHNECCQGILVRGSLIFVFISLVMFIKNVSTLANLYQMVCMRYALRSFILLHKCHAHSYLPPLWLIANLRHISIQLWFFKNISTWGNGHVKTESSSIRSYFMVTLWNSEDKRTELLFIPLFTEQNLDITRMYTFLAIV